MKIHEPKKLFYRIFNDKKVTFLLKWNPKEKQKIDVSLHICIFIHATRNNKQKIIAPPHTTETTPSPPDHCMQKQKFKKKPGELITHHPFVDDVGHTILSHHHQWCSSSCFPTWEVQILEHIVHLNEKLFCLRTKIQVRANSNNQSQRVIERFICDTTISKTAF